MKRKERKSLETEILFVSRGKFTVRENGSMAIPAITEDPEDDQEYDFPEDTLERQKWSWAVVRSGRSSDEEDSSDSLWEETFEDFPAWLREVKDMGTEEVSHE